MAFTSLSLTTLVRGSIAGTEYLLKLLFSPLIKSNQNSNYSGDSVINLVQ
mgnify:CR=1 FL=1